MAKTFTPTLPQIRVLRAVKKTPLDRKVVCNRIGLSPISGTMPRCLNGSKKLGIVGLIPAGMIEEVEIEVHGSKETLLKITDKGLEVLEQATAETKRLPSLRDASLCVNKRYA